MPAAPEPTSRGGVVLGVFVGGASRRMGGQPKGLLVAPSGEAIVSRWSRLAAELGVPCLLVGEPGPYRDLGLPHVDDAIPGAGPLAGLVALLRARTEAHAIAVACDMPHVTGELLARLARAAGGPAMLAPWREGVFEPLFARYARERILPLAERQLAGGDRSLQRLARDAGAEPFGLAESEWGQLTDWDAPGDVVG